LDFHEEGSAKLEAWVSTRLLGILKGRTGQVAGGMRRSATLHGLDETPVSASTTVPATC